MAKLFFVPHGYTKIYIDYILFIGSPGNYVSIYSYINITIIYTKYIIKILINGQFLQIISEHKNI